MPKQVLRLGKPREALIEGSGYLRCLSPALSGLTAGGPKDEGRTWPGLAWSRRWLSERVSGRQLFSLPSRDIQLELYHRNSTFSSLFSQVSHLLLHTSKWAALTEKVSSSPPDPSPQPPKIAELTPPNHHRRQGQALEAGQEGPEGPRRRRQGFPREEARWYETSPELCECAARRPPLTTMPTDEKARKELAAKAGGKKGPLNTGGQGIKKSGKK